MAYIETKKLIEIQKKEKQNSYLSIKESLGCWGLYAGLDDQDEEGETDWLPDAPEYAYEVVVEAVGGYW